MLVFFKSGPVGDSLGGVELGLPAVNCHLTFLGTVTVKDVWLEYCCTVVITHYPVKWPLGSCCNWAKICAALRAALGLGDEVKWYSNCINPLFLFSPTPWPV